MLNKIWKTWRRVGQAIGDFIGRLVLTLFYFTLFMPFGLGVRLWADPLDIKSRYQVGWLNRSTRDSDINNIRRLF
jgi:hypothetical protein